MADVVTNLSNASAEDVRAIGSFIGESLAQARPQQTAAGERNPSETGRALYAEVCGGCHDQGRTYSSGGALQLERAVAVTEPTSKNLMRIAMQGIASPEGTPGRMMPGFADVLTDGQVRDLMGYIREHFAKHPPWNDVDDELKKIREGKK